MSDSGSSPANKAKLVISLSTFLFGYMRLFASSIVSGAMVFPFSCGLGAFLGTVAVHSILLKDIRNNMQADLLLAMQMALYAVVLGFGSEILVSGMALQGGGAFLAPALTAIGMYILS